MHSIRAITLDLDDTLWPFAPIGARIEQVLHDWFLTHSADTARMFPPARMAELRKVVAAAHPELAHDLTRLRQLTIERALKDSGADIALAAHAWAPFHAVRNDVRFFPGARDALARLAARVPVVSLTNGNADLEAIGIRGYFTAEVTARSVGVAKPDARIFAHACAMLGLPPHAVLHIGDDLAMDVRGAHQSGMKTCWIRPADVHGTAAEADWVFDSLADFVDAFVIAQPEERLHVL